MRPNAIVVLFACVWLASADVENLKSKRRVISRLLEKSKHHKRGLLSHVPPFKLGHDIPIVTHSVIKPVVVNYPPTASVTAIKVPISRPVAPHYPVPDGHHAPVSHSHFGHKFPHDIKTVAVTKPDHHFHHHHHHVALRPLVPVVPGPPPAPIIPTSLVPETPIVPVGAATVTDAHPVPAPPPEVIVQSAPVVPAPVPLFPHEHVHFKTNFPSVPLRPATHLLPAAPALPLASPFSYILRPGNAVQTSYFATYPRYPLVNFQNPLIPFTAPAAPAPTDQLFLERPHVPQYHFLPPEATLGGVFEDQAHHAHEAPLDSTPTLLHPSQTVLPHSPVYLQPTPSGAPVDHEGWSPVPQPHNLPTHHYDAPNFVQGHEEHHFTQEQGSQVLEHHATNEQQYHDFEQLHNHIQQQIEQSQYEHNSHQVHQEYGVPHEQAQQHFGQDFSQQDVSHQSPQIHQGQDFSQVNQFALQHQQPSNLDHFSQHDFNHQQPQVHHGQDFSQANQFTLQHQQPSDQYGLPQHIGQEYGQPQQVEGRSEKEDETQQRYHNHIPLGLQLPLDRPLEHFR